MSRKHTPFVLTPLFGVASSITVFWNYVKSLFQKMFLGPSGFMKSADRRQVWSFSHAFEADPSIRRETPQCPESPDKLKQNGRMRSYPGCGAGPLPVPRWPL